MIPTPLRLESPSAAIAAVPYLLGFEAEHCIVVLHLNDSTVGMTMRIPLLWREDDGAPTDDVDQTSAIDEVSIEHWAEDLVSRSAHVQADSVVIICFPDSDRDACERSLDAVRVAYQDLDVHVRDVLMVLRGRSKSGRAQVRWRSLICADVRCCSTRGTPLVEAEADHARAFFVLHGCAPLASRSSLVAELDPGPTARAETVADLVADVERSLQIRLGEQPDDALLEVWRDEAIAHLGRLLGLTATTADRWTEEQIAIVAISLLDARVRDTLVWEYAQLSNRSVWETSCALLADAVRCAPDGCIAPVATLLAQLRWSCGDGARAGIALERALGDDPDYIMARLMRHAISQGIPPESWLETLRMRPRSEFRFGVGRLRSAS